MGGLKVWVAIEALAVKKEVVEEALKNHITRIKNERHIKITKEDFKEALEVEKPIKKIEKAFSQVVEMEFEIDSFRNLVNFIIIYGPSALEIIEPDHLKIEIGEAQDILNSIASIMHQYASMGAGGMVISAK